MATLVLSTAGAAIGGQFGALGAAIGRTAGAFLGNAIDRRIFGRDVEGPRLGDVSITTVGEGVPIPRAYGTVRTSGHLIWATRFEEEATEERQGGKGGPTNTTFSYYGNAAYALCEGPISMVRRIWADGRELDLTEIDYRVHTGAEDQLVDPLIAAKQGDDVPAFRGTAYVVFERLPLERFGNRLPQLSFEVIRGINSVAERTRAITIIPGASEFVYAPDPVTRSVAPGESIALNRHVLHASSDWAAAIDELQAVCPNLRTVSLVVSWFGDDLDAGRCRIRPGVESRSALGSGRSWSVAGYGRSNARLVSTTEGGPAFGGTPDDRSVKDAIRDLRARGLEVFLYPFVLMDVPPGNDLPDPYGGASQAAYPWRGRITCSPAPGRSGTPDGTTSAGDAVAAFVGNDTEPNYAAFIAHCCELAAEAGGVDGLVIGSELRGLTRIRGAAGFPFVDALRAIAADAKARLGAGCAVTYAADWSEYFGYAPTNGSGDLHYNLDPLWADPSIDAVGIDNYMPLSDFRDQDRIDGGPDGRFSPHDADGLAASIEGDEGFDWYYASATDRFERLRTPITDVAHGKPWVYRYKDLLAWWSNAHVERRGGVEVGEPSAWVPGSKPIWFTELGAPAVDKAANQPNVFPDPKSSESARPHFSDATRDDLAQHAFLDAHLRHWAVEPGAEGASPVDPDRIFLWTWDARPFPAFPLQDDVWADGPNWATGHWLNGRFTGAPLGELIGAVLDDHGFARHDTRDVAGWASGLLLRDPANARRSIESVLDVHGVDVTEREGRLVFLESRRRRGLPAEPGDLVDIAGQATVTVTRSPEVDVPTSLALAHVDPLRDHVVSTATVRSPTITIGGRAAVSSSLTLEPHDASRAAMSLLDAVSRQRDRMEITVPWRRANLRPGDHVLDEGGRPFTIETISDGTARRLGLIEALDPVPPRAPDAEAVRISPPVIDSGPPAAVVLDLPPAPKIGSGPFIGATVTPWKALTVLRRVGDGSARALGTLSRPARIGTLEVPLPAGPIGAVDRANRLALRLPRGALESRSWIDVLRGANALAVRCTVGWEIVQYRAAIETGPGQWDLGDLLRARFGTEAAMRTGAGQGSEVVPLDDALLDPDLTVEERVELADWIIGPANAPASLERFAMVQAASGIEGLTPRSPVHLRAREVPAGIEASWVRRGRVDADSWLPADIPLGEERESYRVRFVGASRTVVFESLRAGFVYPAADMAANGHDAGPLTLTVGQLGTHVGEGHRAVHVIRE